MITPESFIKELFIECGNDPYKFISELQNYLAQNKVGIVKIDDRGLSWIGVNIQVVPKKDDQSIN